MLLIAFTRTLIAPSTEEDWYGCRLVYANQARETYALYFGLLCSMLSIEPSDFYRSYDDPSKTIFHSSCTVVI